MASLESLIFWKVQLILIQDYSKDTLFYLSLNSILIQEFRNIDNSRAPSDFLNQA